MKRIGDTIAAEVIEEDSAEEGPVIAAQYLVLDRDINAIVGKMLDPLEDMIIAKVHTMIANNVQSVMDPIRYVLNSRLDITETVLREDGDDEDETGAEGMLQGQEDFTTFQVNRHAITRTVSSRKKLKLLPS